ncbi:MAG: single-stranded-DNA-specific exonuclease RecJ [Patescibacteria group bacterium]|nr:single-stranded-DNA-specific exonuclease RecJ [Patescibacteria group bacterium]
MSTFQQKNWQILPKINDKIIKKYPDYNQVVLQLLFNRGIIAAADKESLSINIGGGLWRGKGYKAKSGEAERIKQFFNPDYKKYSYDPFLFKNMEQAVNLIIKHIKEQNKIIIYGDYDADGVTASAVLVETLDILKAKVDAYIPDRIKEGNGLNEKAISALQKDGVKLIITVDVGIRNKKEVEYAKSLDLDIIITDHHVSSENKDELPCCLTINPILKNEKYPFEYLAGVGVAFKLSKALISKSTLSEDYKKKLEQKILDLVAIGTVADCVSLLGENRVLVKEGLKIINQQKRAGLVELIKVAQINNNKINAWNIGWQIAPRLNVAGRLEHANTAYELLITKNKSEAQAIARRLNDKNIERQEITNEIAEYCKEIVSKKLMDDKILILSDPNLAKDKAKNSAPWPEGVIGLVAGRLCQNFNKPVLVITQSNNKIKGSGRSINEFNIIKAVEQCKEFLDKFGGHAMACGFSVDGKDNLEDFIKKIKQVAGSELAGADLTSKIIIDAELELSEVSERLADNLEKFAPFGEDNQQPKFVSYNARIRDIINMGINGQHVKLKLIAEEAKSLRLQSNRRDLASFWAIAFGQAEQWRDLRINDKIDIVYYIEMNEFNRRREVQLKIVDIKKCG